MRSHHDARRPSAVLQIGADQYLGAVSGQDKTLILFNGCTGPALNGTLCHVEQPHLSHAMGKIGSTFAVPITIPGGWTENFNNKYWRRQGFPRERRCASNVHRRLLSKGWT